MLEAIKHVAVGKRYNWVGHLADLLKINCEHCQELGGSIRFPSLLIWIAMTSITAIGEATFTSNQMPTMKRFTYFILKGKIIGSNSTASMFDRWLQGLKSGFHKWRVPQKIRCVLLLTTHIESRLAYTKVWYADGQAAEPTKLKYIPTTIDIFKDLTR